MADISREDVRPSQIQYQLLTAQLAIGNEYDSAEDAPDGVNEAIEHIQTAMGLLSNPEMPLSEARPDTLELQQADSVVSEVNARDWRQIANSEFVDVARSSIMDEPAFVFENEEIGLHGFRWRSASKTLEAVTFDALEDDDDS